MQELLNFLNNSVTPFQAVKEMEKMLLSEKFTKIDPSNIQTLEEGGKYYLIKDETSLVAFKMGLKQHFNGFNIVATHTDSPTLKIKPLARITAREYEMLNVEVYGGPIISTLFDRVMSIAGRVIVQKRENETLKIESKIVNIDEDLLIIPNVAIHLMRDGAGNTINPQIDLLPLLGFKTDKDFLTFLKERIKLDEEEEILSYDLFLYNREKAKIIGASKEFFSSARIDNLESTYICLKGLLASENADKVNIFVAFNNEEVGSRTKNGAASTLLEDVLDVIQESLNINKTAMLEKLASSFIVSCDNAHAVHPNHLEKADPTNYVEMNKGVVIKHNASTAYTTDGISWGIFKAILDENKVPYQHYTNRSDQRGGSTLGAISLSKVSINSIDIGLAQLAMHSMYETAGTKDPAYLLDAVKAFYNSNITYIDNKYKI